MFFICGVKEGSQTDMGKKKKKKKTTISCVFLLLNNRLAITLVLTRWDHEKTCISVTYLNISVLFSAKCRVLFAFFYHGRDFLNMPAGAASSLSSPVKATLLKMEWLHGSVVSEEFTGSDLGCMICLNTQHKQPLRNTTTCDACMIQDFIWLSTSAAEVHKKCNRLDRIIKANMYNTMSSASP